MNRTIQREAILQELSHKKHPTADEIYLKLRLIIPQLSLATVYRNLEQMTELGIIRKIFICGHQARFDYDTTLHFHIYCTECGRLKNLKSKELLGIDETLQKIVTKHKLSGYEFGFKYICKSCQQKMLEKPQISPEEKKKILSLFD